MLVYINRGLILEQAICSIIHDYVNALNLGNLYNNFHVNVTIDHPFANMYLHEGMTAGDVFPCVVISTQEDRKPAEFDELAIDTYAVGITEEDLESITKTTETYIDSKGNSKTRNIPGLCTVVDSNRLEQVRETIEKQGACYGVVIGERRRDSLGIEIWAENNQLKNELYEQIRLFVIGNLANELEEKYSFFGIGLFDETIVGHRSNNYNFDFDVALSGAHIAFDVNYRVEQIVLNTELTNISKEIITEVMNYVK